MDLFRFPFIYFSNSETILSPPKNYHSVFFFAYSSLPILWFRIITVLCRACLHSFFIDRQSTRELRITRILRDAVI